MAPAVAFPLYNEIEKPDVVLDESFVTGLDPANAEPKLAPSTFTLPAVGVAPAPAELVAVV